MFLKPLTVVEVTYFDAQVDLTNDVKKKQNAFPQKCTSWVAWIHGQVFFDSE